MSLAQKTFKRFWDFSIPSAEVRPTTISKYNTFLQLSLMGLTTIAPLVPLELSVFLTGFQSVDHFIPQCNHPIYMCVCVCVQRQLMNSLWDCRWLVGATTVWSGLSYVNSQGARAVQ